MPEYINKDYYKKLAPNERSFINLTVQNIKTVIDRLEAEHIMFSATVGYKNTITVSNADREKVLDIMKSLPQQNRDNMRIIGNTAYKDLPPADRRYINTDAETALQVANILSGDGKMKFSGRLNGSNATLTVVGDNNAAFVRRIIDNIQNMDLVNELREKGYERISDTNGFVNIRNMQTGETAGFESLKEARNMFLDPDNEFFHPTEMRIEENTFFRIVSDEPNMDYYISEYDPETGEEVAVYLDDEGKCPTFSAVDDAIVYAEQHNIDYTNTNEQLDHWKFNDEERAADREMHERNIIIQTRFPHEDNLYPNDILYNPDSKAFSWVYFNEEGDGGDGEFIDITITEDDVLAAYNSDSFLEYIYRNCKQNVIDTHSGYFEDYAAAYINPSNDVVRRYQELTIQAYLEEHTPAVQEAKKSLEGEITADSDELIIDGYEGTWYVVDIETVDGKEIFLLENEEYGDETFGIIIDKDRNVLVDEAWNGFADYHEKYDNITPEEKLANKVGDEWKAFLEDMKKESPAVLIESAYEISTKDNIQTYITEEKLNLTEKQINALLSRDNILEELYEEWNHNEYLNSYSDVSTLLEDTANAILVSEGRLQPEIADKQLEDVFAEIRKALEEDGFPGVEEYDFDKFVDAYKEHLANITLNGDYPELADLVFGSENSLPFPRHNYEDSAYHDRIVENMNDVFDTERKKEVAKLRLFRSENRECANMIDAMAAKHYENNSFNTGAALDELLEKYSFERIQTIAAANVVELYGRLHDGRIDGNNYEWAKNVIDALPEHIKAEMQPVGANRLTMHPGLIDLFANAVREYEARSIEKKQAKAERTAEDIAIGDRYRYKGADVEVVSMNGIYPNDVGISKSERMGSTEYAVTSNVDKYELHRNGQYLGNGEKTVVSELDMAKKYIGDYLDSEFSSEADFSDMKHISIGYTEIGSEEHGDHSLQMEADLENYSVSYFIDDELAKTEHYDSLEQMNRDHLSVLNFEDMLNVGTTELDRILEEKPPVKAVLAVSQYDTSRYYIANDITEEAVRNAIANSDKLFMDLCDLGGTQITEVEFAQYSQTEGIAAIDVNIDEQTMHIYGAENPIISFKDIKGIDDIAETLDLENNTLTFSVVTIDDEEPFVTGNYVGRYDITALDEYQDYIERTGKQFADVNVEFYQIGGDSESVSADDMECAYISEHLQEVMAHSDALSLESESYSVETPQELLGEEEPEQEEVIEHESEIEWTPIPETADDNGRPTSYATKYKDETFWISQNPDGKFDIEEEDTQGNFSPINDDFSGFMRRGEAEQYFEENIGEYIAERDEKILDAIVGSISEPTPEQREEITRKNNTLNSFFNNNPKAVFREIIKSAGLEPTEDISIGDTKEIFSSLKNMDISLMGYTYYLEFEPHDDRLSVTDTASDRTSEFLWGHAKELMYLIANENNISRENLIYNEVMRGTGFVDGKFRVADFYQANPSKKDFANFLKNEYGIGGHSGDGPVKFADHDSKGIEITLTTGKENFTWNDVAKVISELIEKGEYITQKDIDNRIRRAKLTIGNANEHTDFTSLVHAHEILQKYGIEQSQDNEYKIYQLKNSPENHAIRFEGYSLAEKYGEPAKPENYDLVYSGSLDEFEDSNKLEAIYTKFNLNRPEDFKGHSLSVSDIIVINNEANYVDSFGFVDVSDKFLGKEKEPININEYDTIRLVRRTEWNDRDLSDAENPAFEEITASYTPDEDGSFTKYAFNRTNSINVDVWEDENSVSAENMLADIEAHLRNMRSGVSSAEYHIELTDHDGNIRKLDNNYFNFGMSASPLIEETTDFPEIPINELDRTNYSYGPAIGDILEKGDELYRIADISDNMIILEETSSLFHTMESITLSEFTERGYSLVEAAERTEKIKSPLDTQEKFHTDNAMSPVDTQTDSHSDEVKSPLDTQNRNYVITNENLGVNGPKARFNANVSAVEILKKIEAVGRTATHEEQKILFGYTGWGAIPQAFDPNNADWKNEYEKLKNVLDDAEYSDARRSTLNAHYTSPIVINAIYKGLANLGFEKGKILEPAMGIGNFFGVMPENMRGSELHGVELDDLTGRIAKQLYPNADIQIKGFEKTAFANNSFDVVIGNVPFGNYKVNDKDYNKNNFLIHDYFIAKSLDKVHPGGVVAVITSKGTMDKENDDIRKYIAQRAELLGAIRLPDTAFKANAGTEVVSDILFLQKRKRPIEIDSDKEGWIKLGVSADGFDINNYFAEHPEMVIGDFKEVSGRFGNEITVKLDDPSMLKRLLSEAVQNIKGEYKAAAVQKNSEINADVIPAPAESRKFSFQAVNGELYYREAGDTMKKAAVKGKDKIARAVAMVELRDTVRELLDLQMNNADSSLDDSITESRAKLNKVYDAFVEKYGFVSEKKNKDAFKGDDDYQLLSALENEDKEHNTYTKADIFEHNTVKPKTIAEHVETAQEALIISIAEKAKVDFDFMSELCGMDKDRMIYDLRGQIFRLPQGEEKYVTADEYLTGNIRKKIAELENAPEGMDVSENRTALEKAIPTRVEATDISVKLGSHWIDPEYIRQFICEKFNPDWNAKRAMTVQYSKAAGEWKIEDVNAASKKNYTTTNVFGTHRMHAYKILEGILNNSDLQVKDRKKDENGYEMRDDKGNYILVVNQEETKAVRQVANLIKSEFQDWIFKDPDRREKLVQTYNEMYNSIRPREYDGSHLNFVGMNSDITLKEHQKNAVARALYGGNTLLAHAVGAGKSYEMIAIAMEGKRLGLHTKSLFAVPNSLTEQMGNDFRKLYPNANILVATKKDFEKANRLKLFAKIAANDWDAVIVGHSQFDRMGLSPEREKMYLEAELTKLREEMESAAAYGEKSFSVKKIESAIASYQDKLNKLNDAQVKDDFIDFEKLGFDKLFIDECHMYKNLATATKMHNVSGLGSGGSARSFNLLMKSKYMDELTGGKGMTFASGTPVSNSMCELYTMMRYLQADMLKDCNIDHFDEWAADFGEVKTDYDYNL